LIPLADPDLSSNAAKPESAMTPHHGLFTSESVSEGHPDKLADRIADAILDEFLGLEPDARVACETLLADQCVVVAGEFLGRLPPGPGANRPPGDPGPA